MTKGSPINQQLPIAFFLGAVIVSLLIGAIIMILPSFFLAVLFAGFTLLLVSIFKPSIGFFALLILTFGLIPFLPLDYRVFSELCLYAMLVSVAISLVFSQKWESLYRYIKPWNLPLLLLGIVWVVAFVKGVLISHYHLGIADARRYLGLCAIFVAAAAEAKKPDTVHKLALFFGLLGALELSTQMLTGLHILAGFRGYEELAKGFEDITRGSVIGGIYLIVYTLYYFTLTIVTGHVTGKKISYMLAIILLVLGLIATFSRGLWLGVILAGVVIFILSNKIRVKLLGWVAAIVLLLLVCASFTYLVKPRLFEAAIARVVSVQDEGAKGTSLGARFDENVQAIAAIKENWLLGMGHGGEYKKFLSQTGRGFDNEITFVHNSYLWVLVKMGIFGLGAYLFLVYRIGSLSLQRLGNDGKTDVNYVRRRSVFAALVALLINGITSPVWAQFPDLVALSMLLVIVASASTRIKNT